MRISGRVEWALERAAVAAHLEETIAQFGFDTDDGARKLTISDD